MWATRFSLIVAVAKFGLEIDGGPEQAVHIFLYIHCVLQAVMVVVVWWDIELSWLWLLIVGFVILHIAMRPRRVKLQVARTDSNNRLLNRNDAIVNTRPLDGCDAFVPICTDGISTTASTPNLKYDRLL
jgi:hypothetical protein